MFTNLTNLITPFKAIESKMDLVTKTVHQLVIEGNFMSSNSRKIETTIQHMIDTAGLEVLDKAFVGKLRHKLPHLPMAGFNKFQKAKAQLIFSAILVQFLIEEEVIRTRDEVKSMINNDGKKIFTKERFLVFNSEVSIKNLLADIEFVPAVLRDKSTKIKAGGKEVKYGSAQKAMLRGLASHAFKLSDYTSKDILLHGYTLSQGYKSTMAGKSQEHPILAKRRYLSYANAIMNIRTIGEFYLTNWFDSRNRMYYHLNLEGIRPQGKLWETLMIDSATPYIINEVGYKHLIHILMVTLEGRMTAIEAMDKFTEQHLITAESIDPLAQTDEDDFGDAILLNKLAMAHEQYMRAEPCNFIFGKDLTNSGVGIAGNSFHSPQMMNAGNYGGTNEAVDSHNMYAKGYGLARNLIKSAHTGLLHGSTFKTMTEMLRETITTSKLDDHKKIHGEFKSRKDLEAVEASIEASLDYLTPKYVKDASLSSYGAEVLNIDAIASWGGDIIANNDTTLMWTTADGWKAQSTSYMEKVPLTLYIVSSKTKSNYATWNLTSDMPLIVSARGELIYGKEDGVVVKKRGLFANITHAVDATLLRHVVNHSIENNYASLYKHDDYMLPLNAFDDIIVIGQDFMQDVRDNNPYQLALEEISANHTTKPAVPMLLKGNAENTISASVNFLMP